MQTFSMAVHLSHSNYYTTSFLPGTSIHLSASFA